jgi:CubicO group peptidase (beta-lactamase class C family)
VLHIVLPFVCVFFLIYIVLLCVCVCVCVCVCLSAKVQAAFAANFAQGRELNAQLCILHGHEVVVDLYGTGVSHSHHEEEPIGCDPPGSSYSLETIQPIFSSGKNLEAVVVAILVDRNVVQYDDPIAQHWPAFGQNGKQNITIADLMRHAAGMAYFINPNDENKFTLLTLDDIQNRHAMHRVMEQAPPQRFGTSKRSYHAYTRGLVLDGILQHVDGRTIGEFATQEILQPLGLADCYFVRFDRELYKDSISVGFCRQLPVMFSACHEIGPALLGMGSPIIKLMMEALGPESIVVKASSGMDQVHMGMKDGVTGAITPTYMNTNPQARKAEVTSAMSMANARAMSQLMAPLCNGGKGVNGVRLFTQETARMAFAQVVTEADDTMLGTCAFSQGGLCHAATLRDRPQDNEYKGFWGWGGWGGSINLINPEAQVTVSYAMTAMGNQMLGDDRTDKIMTAVAQVIRNNK